MKGTRFAALLTALLMLCGAALADGGGATLIGGSEGTTGTAFSTVRPTSWTPQNSEGIFYKAMDGDAYTVYSYTAWNSLAMDEIPEVTFTFNGATITDIWIRNGNQCSEQDYFGNARIRRINVDIYSSSGVARYEYRMTDQYDPWTQSSDWYGGYQRMHLPRTQTGVYQVDFWILGWYRGNVSTYNMSISDIAFAGQGGSGGGGGAGIGTAASTTRGEEGGGYNPSGSVGIGSAASTSPGSGSGASGAASASSYPSSVITVQLNQRMATRSGPGTNYTETGSYFTAGTNVQAISAAYDTRNGIWWIQTEFSYQGVKRRAYTGLKRLNMNVSQVPQETLIWQDVEVSSTTRCYWGPGYDYTMYEFQIPAGTIGAVYQAEGDFAQLEYYDSSLGILRRVWIPMSALSTSFG